jgi:hypothetical protein
MYLKDLKVLEGGRNLSEIVIFDNTVAILTVYLKSLLYEEDVRDKISRDFGI